MLLAILLAGSSTLPSLAFSQQLSDETSKIVDSRDAQNDGPGLVLSVSPKLHALQQRWAKVNYTLQGDEQLAAFESLISQARALTQEQPNNAGYWAWLGICQSTSAAAIGGTGALALAKKARKSLEKSIKLDDNALDGAAMTTLGALYHKLPGWPLSFGSDKKAKKLLAESVERHPTSIDANFFFAEFLFDDNDNSAAREYLLLAQQAPTRPERPMADKYRRIAVETLLKEIDKK
nr:hypothetical protein [Paraglaciecola sp. 20A4]